MPCPESGTTIYLFLSGELNDAASRRFEAHLQNCRECRQQLTELRELRGLLHDLCEKPKSGVARRLVRREKLSDVSTNYLSRFGFSGRSRYWGVAVAAAAVIMLLFMLTHYEDSFYDSSDTARREAEADDAWRDYFLAETDWFNSEIERLESGALLTDIFSGQPEMPGEEMRLSTMSDELIWVRGRINSISNLWR